MIETRSFPSSLSYTHMIEQARKHGWIDAETNTIRAHVEREA